MKNKTWKRPIVFTVILFLGVSVLIITGGCNAKADLPTSIIMDFPHGETRLHVNNDGTAYLFYGALPQHEVVRPDTFELDNLFNDLQDKIHPNAPLEERPAGQAYGMVTFRFSDGREEDYLIYDGDFAETYFEIARANIVGLIP